MYLNAHIIRRPKSAPSHTAPMACISNHWKYNWLTDQGYGYLLWLNSNGLMHQHVKWQKPWPYLSLPYDNRFRVVLSSINLRIHLR